MEEVEEVVDDEEDEEGEDEEGVDIDSVLQVLRTHTDDAGNQSRRLIAGRLYILSQLALDAEDAVTIAAGGGIEAVVCALVAFDSDAHDRHLHVPVQLRHHDRPLRYLLLSACRLHSVRDSYDRRPCFTSHRLADLRRHQPARG